MSEAGAPRVRRVATDPSPIMRNILRRAASPPKLSRRWFEGRAELLRHLVALSGGHVASKLIGFVAFAYLARTLEPVGYGAVEYLVGLSVLAATLIEGGLGPVGVRRIAHHRRALPIVAAQIPAARLVLALISVPVMVLVATPAMREPAARELAWLFAFSLLAAPWRQEWLMQATERIPEAAVAQLVRMLVFALLILAFVRDPTDVLVVGWAEIASVSAMSLYCLAVQHARITPIRFGAPADGFAALVREGAVVGLGNAVWAAHVYAPLLLVAIFVDPVATALFAAASRVIGSLLTFSNVYHFNLYPTVAHATVHDRDELARILAASFRVAAWAGTFVAVTVSLLAGPVSVLLFGSRFAAAGPLLMVMAWMLPISLLSGHARWSLVAAGSQSRVLSAQVAGLVSVALLGIPLVLRFGAYGAALASVVAFVAVWVTAHRASGAHGIRLPAPAIALAPGAVALVVIAGTHVLGLRGWSAGLGAVVFAAAALLDRRLPADIRQLGTARRSSHTPVDVHAGPDDGA